MNPVSKALQTIRAAWSGVPGRNGWPRYYWQGEDAAECDPRGLASVYSAVSLLSGLMASLPHRVVKNMDAGGIETVSGTDVARLIAELDFTRKEQVYLDLMLNGNGYLRKIYRNGRLHKLEVLDAYRMTLLVDENKVVFYRVDGDGFLETEQITYPADEIVHFKFRVGGGYSTHPLLGISPLSACCESMAMVGHIASGTSHFYKNVSIPAGCLQTDMKMSGEQIAQLRESWDQQTTGVNAGGVPILTHNLKWESGGGSRSAIDNSLAEIQRVSVLEVARAFGIPAQLLNETSSLNYSTSVEMHRSFAAMTLEPLTQRLSDCYTHSLIPYERRAQGVRIDVDAGSLLVGSGVDKAKYYGDLITSGIMTVDEVRHQFALPPGEEAEEVDPQENIKSTLKLIQGMKK